ncbi:MAG TPA: hypothetical protein VF604_12805 [Pyrinomonadaceae bacterium]|jgi:hypothetical protein
MKKLMVKLLVVVMIVLTISETGFADIRVRFARGRTSATVSGRVGTGGRVCYVANARAGQTLTATISSRSGQVRIFESGETSYQTEIEYSGDQSVCVDNLRGATTYSLTVSIR